MNGLQTYTSQICYKSAAPQGSGGCTSMAWRNEEGGYLREILMARVYDVAIESPLEEATRLSEQASSSM